MKRASSWFATFFLMAAVLAACNTGKHPAALSAEAFLKALVDKDEAGMVALTCSEFETDALLEYDAFSLVKTRLEGLDCQTSSEQDNRASVTCQGTIKATYGSEDQDFELSDRVYSMVKQSGDWLVCGE